MLDIYGESVYQRTSPQGTDPLPPFRVRVWRPASYTTACEFSNEDILSSIRTCVAIATDLNNTCVKMTPHLTSHLTAI